MAAALLAGGCDAPQIAPNEGSQAARERGREAATRHGCGACHRLPGIDWPAGRVGPDLRAFAAQSLIAGRLPNRPDSLAAFVRDAPALVPGTAMPAIPMSPRDARDIAAWLQGDDAR